MSERFYREPETNVILSLTPFEAKALRNQLRGIEQSLPVVDVVLMQIATGLGLLADTPVSSLRPCPFCAEDSALSVYSCGRHAVNCGICFTEGPSADTPAAAIEGWNTRTPRHLDKGEG